MWSTSSNTLNQQYRNVDATETVDRFLGCRLWHKSHKGIRHVSYGPCVAGLANGEMMQAWKIFIREKLGSYYDSDLLPSHGKLPNLIIQASFVLQELFWVLTKWKCSTTQHNCPNHQCLSAAHIYFLSINHIYTINSLLFKADDEINDSTPKITQH